VSDAKLCTCGHAQRDHRAPSGRASAKQLKDAKPSKNMERKPVPAPKPPAAPLVPMCRPLPPKRVELPALGGCVEILYDWGEKDGWR
jgi:hypothetical protein